MDKNIQCQIVLTNEKKAFKNSMVGSLGQCTGFTNWVQHSQARSENGYGMRMMHVSDTEKRQEILELMLTTLKAHHSTSPSSFKLMCCLSMGSEA